MKTLYLDDFLDDGIIKENSFRKKIDLFDWKQFNNEKVLIKGCASAPIPTWAYLIIATKLTKHASDILFGEACAAVKIFKKN